MRLNMKSKNISVCCFVIFINCFTISTRNESFLYQLIKVFGFMFRFFLFVIKPPCNFSWQFLNLIIVINLLFVSFCLFLHI